MVRIGLCLIAVPLQALNCVLCRPTDRLSVLFSSEVLRQLDAILELLTLEMSLELLKCHEASKTGLQLDYSLLVFVRKLFIVNMAEVFQKESLSRQRCLIRIIANLQCLTAQVSLAKLLEENVLSLKVVLVVQIGHAASLLITHFFALF